MFTRPDVITDAAIISALRDGWGFDAVVADYLPVGFGSHHWMARAADGARRFVTVDDLGSRDYLGPTSPEAYDALKRAFATVRTLHECGLDWVVGPCLDSQGQVLRWLDGTFSIAVFPYVEGHTSPEYASDEERTGVVNLLTELHRSTERAAAVARRETFAVPNRADLELAMAEVAIPWTGGPYSEPARLLLFSHLDGVRGHLADYDRLAQQALDDPGKWHITHGEPHSRNVLRTDAGLQVIDWDTALVAPPERDLWMLAATASDPVAQQYTAATGHAVDTNLLRLYAVRWDLDEVGGYVAGCRAPHRETEDAAESWRNLQHFIRGYERA
jgi:spectinomycin phosphotransferase